MNLYKLPLLIIFIFTLLIFWQFIVFFSKNSTETFINYSEAYKQQVVIIDKHSPIFSQPLFGQYVAATGKLKQSLLNVEIVGIMFSKQESLSHVVIRLADGKEKIYSVGDSLVDGYKLSRIKKNSIEISYNNSIEVLQMPKSKLLFAKPANQLLEE